jgi:hypothetical protein
MWAYTYVAFNGFYLWPLFVGKNPAAAVALTVVYHIIVILYDGAWGTRRCAMCDVRHD